MRATRAMNGRVRPHRCRRPASRGRRRLAAAVLATAGLAWAAAAGAAGPDGAGDRYPDLYTARVMAEDRGNIDLALVRAMRAMLVRVTGLRRPEASRGVREAFANPERYVQQYLFEFRRRPRPHREVRPRRDRAARRGARTRPVEPRAAPGDRVARRRGRARAEDVRGFRFAGGGGDRRAGARTRDAVRPAPLRHRGPDDPARIHPLGRIPGTDRARVAPLRRGRGFSPAGRGGERRVCGRRAGRCSGS